MIRGINKKDIIKNFKDDSNCFNYALEYGIYEAIDSHLYYTYEGNFSYEEVDEIIELLQENIRGI